MGFIARFLSGYTENFLVAVALWPLASAALTLPIIAWLYHRDGRLRFGSAVSTYLAVLYVLGLGCFTLWPLPSGDSGLGITYGVPWQLDPLAFVGDFLREGVSTLPQIAFNVVLFMPLGFIAGRLLRWGFWRSVIVGFLASLLIEAAQGTGLFGVYPYAYRTADVDDLIYNTSGAALGWACAAALARVLPPGAQFLLPFPLPVDIIRSAEGPPGAVPYIDFDKGTGGECAPALQRGAFSWNSKRTRASRSPSGPWAPPGPATPSRPTSSRWGRAIWT